MLYVRYAYQLYAVVYGATFKVMIAQLCVEIQSLFYRKNMEIWLLKELQKGIRSIHWQTNSVAWHISWQLTNLLTLPIPWHQAFANYLKWIFWEKNPNQFVDKLLLHILKMLKINIAMGLFGFLVGIIFAKKIVIDAW